MLLSKISGNILVEIKWKFADKMIYMQCILFILYKNKHFKYLLIKFHFLYFSVYKLI